MQSSINKVRFFSSLMIAVVITLTSCSDDDNVSIDPTARVPFLGSYKVKDQNSDESKYFSFTLDIEESEEGPDKVNLRNFRYINNGLYATISGSKFHISQTIQDSDERIEIIGEGTLTGNTLMYNYKIVLKESGKTPRVFENTAEATRVD